MTHPTPPLSGEDLLLDDEDVILLTDEIPPAENHDLIEICQLADPFEPREVMKLSETAKEKPSILDLSDVIEPADYKPEFPPDFSISEADILNFELEDSHAPDFFLQGISPSTQASELFDSQGLASETATSTPLSASDITPLPETESQADDLQRLIDEVVHDSQVPPQDFSVISQEISKPKDTPILNDELASLSQDQIDAAVERVIQNLFAERIENILDEVIATTVTREIKNLKTILLDYLISGKAVHKVKS